MLDEPIDVAPLASAFERLRDRFPEAILGASFARRELVVRVRREDIVPVLRFLKYEAGFNALNDIVGLDNLRPVPPAKAAPAAPSVATVPPSGRTGEAPAMRFTVLYLLYRFPEGCRIRIAVDLDECDAVDSAVPIYRAADWAEREIFDMFGIVFSGHPDLRRVYMPDEFDGHPLRKDFPLEGKTGGV
jgi:NADH-quinone oxidoreductase subunit C